ncbi:MAG: hypothetical protein HWQ38_09445 [Nostoc sp. NMS7]|uniref:hypothetical protein n=1 Tax=Nostoc sp. NMS7 TaxID=2815391 RepID=UPI0025D08E42|nr:hypothetical protein [Nostoc sp. NMS7]MBN3946696.1 hypothetical protein [Nostoc sp. NMS7]
MSRRRRARSHPTKCLADQVKLKAIASHYITNCVGVARRRHRLLLPNLKPLFQNYGRKISQNS